MEKDKLEEGKKTFTEDREKYEKFKLDLTAKSQQTEDDVRKVQIQIENLTQTIGNLKKEEGEILSKESKLEEEIVLHKASKKFLYLLAIASKNKKPVNQRKRIRQKLQERAENASSMSQETERQHQNNRTGSTFVTQAAQVANSNSASKKGGLKAVNQQKATIGKSSFIKASPRADDNESARTRRAS